MLVSVHEDAVTGQEFLACEVYNVIRALSRPELVDETIVIWESHPNCALISAKTLIKTGVKLLDMGRPNIWFRWAQRLGHIASEDVVYRILTAPKRHRTLMFRLISQAFTFDDPIENINRVPRRYREQVQCFLQAWPMSSAPIAIRHLPAELVIYVDSVTKKYRLWFGCRDRRT